MRRDTTNDTCEVCGFATRATYGAPELARQMASLARAFDTTTAEKEAPTVAAAATVAAHVEDDARCRVATGFLNE
jgi:hypothetical protein